MGARTDNTIVVIPSYNEVRTIGEIVHSVVRIGMTALVIDDGSVDSTERSALDAGAMVIRNKINMGKGASVRIGIEYVLEKTNFEWVIMMDGDGQHHPEDIPSLMAGAGDDETDIVIGNRMQETKTMPSLRYWTNVFTSWVVSGMCGQRVPDTQCGYRLMRASALSEIHLTSDKYDIESEMIMRAGEKKMRIKSVPIRTIYGEEVSQIHPVHDTIRFFALIFRHFFRLHESRKTEKKDDR